MNGCLYSFRIVDHDEEFMTALKQAVKLFQVRYKTQPKKILIRPDDLFESEQKALHKSGLEVEFVMHGIQRNHFILYPAQVIKRKPIRFTATRSAVK